MSVNEIFFAESGLTSTSANHVANLAKEFVQNVENEVINVQFYDSEVTLIGTENYQQLEEGINDGQLADIPGKLQKIAKAKSLIAWLREAIKARTSMLNAVEKLDMSEWADMFGTVLPLTPQKRTPMTKEDVIAQMNIKERNTLYALETEAAVIGKYIHPDGKFADARQKYLSKLHNKHEVKGEGRDTLLYKYTPSVGEGVLEDTYFKLQKRHREVQAQLNGILHEVDEKVRQDQLEALTEYNGKYASYRAEMQELDARFEEYKKRESMRLAALKIVIPNDLKDIYDIVNSLGK